jgi:hypothetical protein
MAHFTITEETAAQLERRKDEIEREMDRLREEYQRVTRQLEAIPLFLAEANGISARAEDNVVARESISVQPRSGSLGLNGEAPKNTEEMSLPMKVKLALQRNGRMTPLELRDALMKMGVERERFGATFSYLYTVLGRLEQRGQIQKVRGKFQLPSGVTYQHQPAEGLLRS